MKCTCPKCQAKIELELPTEVTEEGSTASCPACSARFSVHRESFAGRALRKPGEISCAACGEELGPELHCASCGRPFPNYIVVGAGRKRAAKRSQSLNLNINLFPSRSRTDVNVPSLSEAGAEQLVGKKRSQAGKKGVNKRAGLAFAMVAVLAVAIGGGSLYLKKSTEKSYGRNFAIACYMIQVGADKSRKSSQKVASDWKGKLDTGQSYVPRTSVDDDRAMVTIKTRLETVKGKLAKGPEKYSGCTEKLAKLEAAFDKLRKVPAAPGNSLPDFNNSANQADAKYRQAVADLKAGLPPELMDELRTSAQKYRGLRPLLENG